MKITGTPAMLLGSGSILVCLGLATILYAVRGRSSRTFGRSVWRGGGRRRSVALTFDDGPSPASLGLAHFLAAEGVRATFFVCGENVRRHPGVLRQLLALGHEVGNHTDSHRRLCPRLGWKLNLLTSAEVETEIVRCQQAIVADCAVEPRLFRAPYGMRWLGVAAAQRRLRLLGVMWTVIGEDWHWTPEQVVGHVLKAMRPGAIVCLHDGRDTRANPDVRVTLDAVRDLVPRLKAMGYRFETVSDILRSDGQVQREGSTAVDTYEPARRLASHPGSAASIWVRE